MLIKLTYNRLTCKYNLEKIYTTNQNITRQELRLRIKYTDKEDMVYFSFYFFIVKKRRKKIINEGREGKKN